jgi:hypothetical protein
VYQLRGRFFALQDAGNGRKPGALVLRQNGRRKIVGITFHLLEHFLHRVRTTGQAGCRVYVDRAARRRPT